MGIVQSRPPVSPAFINAVCNIVALKISARNQPEAYPDAEQEIARMTKELKGTSFYVTR